jgi:hypothetical protein
MTANVISIIIIIINMIKTLLIIYKQNKWRQHKINDVKAFIVYAQSNLPHHLLKRS